MPEEIRYFDGQRLRRLKVQSAYEARQQAPRREKLQPSSDGLGFLPARPQAAGHRLVETLLDDRRRLRSRFSPEDVDDSTFLVMPVDRGDATVVPTETVAVDRARKSDLQWLRRNYGMQVEEEGSHGKVLLRSPDAAADPVQHAAEAALALHDRGGPSAAHPNFLRVIQRPPLSVPPPGAQQWALDNQGVPGLIGADVHAIAAWTMTKGSDQIRVAILDEGVDTTHPFLVSAVVAEKDFVDGNSTARPDGNDAHGTACAGIVASRDDQVSGLAPGCSLIAARIAKSDAQGFWIFDDFETADAIDWCWDDAGGDILSNSWGGGPPVPIITRAFERARTLGRTKRGALVVVAAGNNQRKVDYPGNLADVLAVGASNQWDERKTRTSKDGEKHWGSNYGPGLDLIAPGVAITTTDIDGAQGYGASLTTSAFNGTSAATPFVSAAAALMLSIKPDLTERRLRDLLRSTADALVKSGGWDSHTGHGRLNCYAATRAARRG